MSFRGISGAALAVCLIAACSNGNSAQASQSDGAPQQAGTAASARGLLSEDLLSRLIAVTREAQAVDSAAMSDDDDDDEVAPSSLAAMGQRLDANPQMHAILQRHGLDGQGYIAGLRTVAQTGAAARLAGTKWASRLNGGKPVDPRNIAFYNEHSTQVETLQHLLNPDASSQEADEVTADLRGIDPDDFDDCVTLAPAIMSVAPLATAGSAATSPSDRVKLAESTGDMAQNFTNLGLRKDFTTMADEIRRHASEPRLESPAFGAALGDARQWAAQHCKGADPQ